MSKILDKSMKDILSRSTAEKILVVESLWENIREEALKDEPTQEEISLVKDRLEEYKKNPSKVKTWDEVKKNYLKGK